MSPRLAHDVCWEGAARIVEVFAPLLLRSEEQLEARREVYQCLRLLIDEYQSRLDHETSRICPSNRNGH
jgi:hypothetical protein